MDDKDDKQDTRPDIDTLLLKRAADGLTDDEQAMLATLLERAGRTDSDEYELAAAAVAAASADATSLPESLRTKILSEAPAYVGVKDELAERRQPRTMDWGWAAAAALALAFVGSQLYDAPASDPMDARAALLAADDTLQLSWSASDYEGFGDVDGDVVWSDQAQEGYLTLVNVPANDPTVSQYQLWVVDPDRDDEPVDGGVFDVPPGADRVIIPINAKLRVDSPVAFAITREKPGGVVVSSEPLLLVASVG